MGESIQNDDFINDENIVDGLKPIFENIDTQFGIQKPTTVTADGKQITDISEVFAPAKKQATPGDQDPEALQAKKEAAIAEKRYSDSTAENQRIMAENKAYAPFKNLLDTLVKDDALASRVNDLITEKGTPKSVVDQLNLPEDFKFSQDDAMTDPTSDSAKLQYAIIGDAVEKRFSTLAEKQNRSVEVSTQKEEIRKEIGNDEIYGKFMKYLQNLKPNYKDFLRLFTMDEREKLVATEAGKRVLLQVQKASELGTGNLGGMGDIETDVNSELAFFKNNFGLGDLTNLGDDLIE